MLRSSSGHIILKMENVDLKYKQKQLTHSSEDYESYALV